MDKKNSGKHISETGTEIWYKDGKKHRRDGPAVIRSCGVIEYWLYGRQVTSSLFSSQKGDLK